jgi:hypothetical protein
VGFFDPINLVFALSLAALILIYLRARSRPTIDVSSLMLFEEVPAPVAQSRILRVDALFWLEMLALAALTLAVAGLYIHGTEPAGRQRSHALIFDLGAGMGALDGRVMRLDEARRRALEIVSTASAREEFSIIGYALEAETICARTARKDEVRAALNALRPLAVAARPAAMRAALINARGAERIDLFTDREPSKTVIEEAHPNAAVEVHQYGAAADNLALVALDPGVPKSSEGRCVVRNFSTRPQRCMLKIDAGSHELVNAPLILEPREQQIIPFGPLLQGGLVHARILTPDALAADNERYALAPNIAQAHALVMSPEREVREDLARIVLAINPNFLVTVADPLQSPFDSMASEHYDLAVLHDCSDAAVNAAAKLFIFPEPWFQGSKRPPVVPVVSTVAMAELESRENVGPLGTPVLLGASRVVELPGWMDPIARGTTAGAHDSFPLAAAGRNADGEVGVITFDIRKHLLLDPDRMDALVLTIDTLKQLTSPADVKIVSTGAFVSVSTFTPVVVYAPDGMKRTVQPDQRGLVHFRALEAGRYIVWGGDGVIDVYANYYDAAESDLDQAPRATASSGKPENVSSRGEIRLEPVALPLIALALFLLLAESVLVARRAMNWRVHHV